MGCGCSSSKKITPVKQVNKSSIASKNFRNAVKDNKRKVTRRVIKF